MLKRLLGILFALAALATFVWVARGRYSSWCFGRGTAAVEATAAETLRCGDASGSGHAADSAAPADSSDSSDSAGSSGSSAPDAPAPAQPTAAKPLQ